MAKHALSAAYSINPLIDTRHTYIPSAYPMLTLGVLYRGKCLLLHMVCVYDMHVVCQEAHQRKVNLDKHFVENSSVLPGINACADKHWNVWLTPSWTMFLLEIRFVLILQFKFIYAPFVFINSDKVWENILVWNLRAHFEFSFHNTKLYRGI